MLGSGFGPRGSYMGIMFIMLPFGSVPRETPAVPTKDMIVAAAGPDGSSVTTSSASLEGVTVPGVERDDPLFPAVDMNPPSSGEEPPGNKTKSFVLTNKKGQPLFCKKTGRRNSLSSVQEFHFKTLGHVRLQILETYIVMVTT